jgi:hypothetical protein
VSLSNVQVGVDQRVRADIKLEVGAMTESVEIVAQTPLVQTSSSDLSTTVTEEQIKQLPLNGRNFVSLTRTIPGVLRGIPGANIDGAGSLAWRASAAFSANGQRPRDNNYLLDGVDNNETWLQTVVIFPSVDALDEFKLQTSTYSARVRQVARRRGQPPDQVGLERLPRQRPSSSTATTASTPTTSSTTGRPRQAGLRPEPVRRHPRRARSSRARRSSSVTTRASGSRPARRICRRCRPCKMRNGDFSS